MFFDRINSIFLVNTISVASIPYTSTEWWLSENTFLPDNKMTPSRHLCLMEGHESPLSLHLMQTWNDLPEDVTSAEALTTFRHLLKTHLFKKSFPDYLLDIN